MLKRNKKNILLITISTFILACAIFLISITTGCNTSQVSKNVWPSNLAQHQEGLDYYTLDELKDVANWLSENCDTEGFEESLVYTTFNQFKNEGQIWFSNSNGQILCSVGDIGKSADCSKCNQDYKLTFNGVSRDIDNFLFLKIIGICEDEKTDGGKAGLTFETVSALPIGTEYGEPNSWWGNSIVRQSLQEGGSLYSQLDTANHAFTSKIVEVNKYSQQTRRPEAGSAAEKNKTSDAFFLPSVSETFPLNNFNADLNYLKDGGEGNQYSYFKLYNFDLETNNKDKAYALANYKTNSGNTATNTTNNEWGRSLFRSVGSDGTASTKNNNDPLGLLIYTLSQGSLTKVKLGDSLTSWYTETTTFRYKYSCPVAPMFCF